MATTEGMTRIGKLKGVPWRRLVVSAIVVLALSAGLARGVGAATRFVATSGNDSANICLTSGAPCKTITHALGQALAGDTISVAAGTYNLALGETFPLTINTNLTLTGAGAGSTILDATGANQRVIMIGSVSTVAIAGVTITGGAASCASSGSFCIASGGGIDNEVGGTLTLTNSTVSGNTVSCTASALGFCDAWGGGLFGATTVTNSTVSGNTVSCTASGKTGSCTAQGGGLFGATTVTNSTVSGNTVSCTASEFQTASEFECTAQGGGLFGATTVTNSTVSGNTVSCTASASGTNLGVCDADGGGLHSSGMAWLTNVTVSGNTVSCTASGFAGCSADGGGLHSSGMAWLTNVTVTANTVTCSGTGCATFGVGLDNAGFTMLHNTIVAKQVAGSDCTGAPTSNGFNLDSDNTCQFTQPSDHPGVSSPLLGPLANNGGPTQTHALLSGSPAIDAGTNTGCPSTDQRGVARPQGSACDIGAYEFGPAVATVTLNGSGFHTAQTVTYQATLSPGAVPTQVDIYLGVLLPDGVTFLSFVPGPGGTIAFAFGPVPVPFAANVTLTPTVVPFAYTFTGTEPIGTYFTYAGLAVAGSDPLQAANQLSVGIQAFQFTP